MTALPWQADAVAHARAELPREACGLVVEIAGQAVYRPCRNVATSPADTFEIEPEEFVSAEDEGRVLAVVHSHPHATPGASEDDVAECRRSRLPWFVLVDVEEPTWVVICP
ncbi:C40 family peptidase [Hydrocarboniphaga effusa]|uniref:C40 family peptidase n=1 Tax=Hydrocarboniphaga effusa TaxID=243629 RepID=UPI003BAD5A0C